MKRDKLILLREIQQEIEHLQKEVNWRAEIIRRAEEVKADYPKLLSQLREYERQHDELLLEIMTEGKPISTPCVVDLRKMG